MARFAFSSIIFQRANILILDEVFLNRGKFYPPKLNIIWMSFSLVLILEFLFHNQSQKEKYIRLYIMSAFLQIY